MYLKCKQSFHLRGFRKKRLLPFRKLSHFNDSNYFQGATNTKYEDISMQVNEVVIRLKIKTNLEFKKERERLQRKGVATSTVWYKLKKKQKTDELKNFKKVHHCQKASNKAWTD